MTSLPIERETFRAECVERRGDIGEVAGERLSGFGLGLDDALAAGGNRAEAVPLGPVLLIVAGGEGLGGKRVPCFDDYVSLDKSNLPRESVSGCQRSPNRRTRSGTFSRRKSSSRNPRSTSSQVTGMETVACGFGRTE